MQLRAWNLGNTTVRNPERIKGALFILARDFVGQKFDYDAQDRFFDLLLREDVIQSSGKPVKDESKRESARKWAAAFNQLGLAKCWQRYPPIEVTEPGLALLDDLVHDSDVFLRQLWKVQMPSPTETSSPVFNVHPLYIVVNAALKLKNRGLTGISKEEISIFIQTTLRDEDINEALERINDYRNRRAGLAGKVEKRRFYRETLGKRVSELYGDLLSERFNKLDEFIARDAAGTSYMASPEAEELLKEITSTGKGANVQSAAAARREIIGAYKDGQSIEELQSIITEHQLGLKMRTLIDYTDTTVRYSRITGLFSLTADKLVLKDDQTALAEELIAKGPEPILSDSDFAQVFYDAHKPILPTDDVVFLKEDIERLKTQSLSLATELSEQPPEELPTPSLEDVLQLRGQRNQLEENLMLLKEKKFYLAQRNEDQIQEIKDVFESLLNNDDLILGSDYRPAIAEWAVWRLFLAIDSIPGPIEDTRNFQIDTDLRPVHHAKAGFADMVFVYDDLFIVPVEVTLHTGERQYAAEGEPVQRHVLHIADKNIDHDVVGVFVAPKIHPAAAHEFFNSEMYSERREDVIPLSIVPLSIEQAMNLMPGETYGCNNPVQLRHHLNCLLTLRGQCTNGKDWLQSIDRYFSA